MKRAILFFIIIIVFQNCNKIDDDTEKGCDMNCTTLKGRFVTEKNMPLKDIKLRLEYRINNSLYNSNTRIIKEARTDGNGYYKMEFLVEESELGINARGYFALLVDATNLNPENYIFQDEIYIGDAIYSLTTRDTVMDKSFYIPTKDFIRVTLNDFSPTQEGDFFKVQTLYPSGLYIGDNDFLDSKYQTGLSGYDNYSAKSENQTFEDVFVARNEKNVIRINKIKNGIGTSEDFEIFVPENNTIMLTYKY